MTEPAGPTVQVGEEQPREHEVAVTEVFHWVYRLFYSKTVGLILILLMAFYAVFGSLIMQAQPGTFDDPAAKAQFLAQAQEVYGGWTSILNAVGFFHIFTSVGFYVIVSLLALSIIACTVHRIPELWKRYREPRVHVAARFFAKARYRGTVPTTASSTETLEAARRVLRRNRFRYLEDPREPGVAAYADRYAWSGIGTVIAHLSFILILAAFVISSTWGIEEDLAVPVGGSVPVGHGTDLSVQALSFKDSYTETGRPADYVSVIQILDGDEVLAEQEVRVNSPLDYGGFRFHQSSFGIAADVSIADASGETLFSGSVPLKWTSNDGQKAVGRVDLEGLEVVVVTPASGAVDSGIPVGTAVFEVYQAEAEEPLGVVGVTQGESETVEGYTVSFERERQYTGIRMRQDPGAPWMWVGSILLVVGMSITFMFPYRRLWLRHEEGELLFGAVSRLDYSYQRMFEKLVAEVDQELGSASREENHG